MADMVQDEQLGGEAPKGPGLKVLEAAVYIMGGLLVLMVFGLLGGIAWKLTHRAAAPEASDHALDIAVPEGATVGAMTLDGDRLAVHLLSGGKSEIIVVDTRKGVVLSRIKFASPKKVGP
ncbi:MAG: hypothetical protein ACJ8AS_04670 [Hyphomicrobiales bacterium]